MKENVHITVAPHHNVYLGDNSAVEESWFLVLKILNISLLAMVRFHFFLP
jgi:hypothetical protein